MIYSDADIAKRKREKERIEQLIAEESIACWMLINLILWYFFRIILIVMALVHTFYGDTFWKIIKRIEIVMEYDERALLLVFPSHWLIFSECFFVVVVDSSFFRYNSFILILLWFTIILFFVLHLLPYAACFVFFYFLFILLLPVVCTKFCHTDLFKPWLTWCLCYDHLECCCSWNCTAEENKKKK